MNVGCKVLHGMSPSAWQYMMEHVGDRTKNDRRFGATISTLTAYNFI
jgi:hypothetical protein